jgi:hypothetical protein
MEKDVIVNSSGVNASRSATLQVKQSQIIFVKRHGQKLGQLDFFWIDERIFFTALFARAAPAFAIIPGRGRFNATTGGGDMVIFITASDFFFIRTFDLRCWKRTIKVAIK